MRIAITLIAMLAIACASKPPKVERKGVPDDAERVVVTPPPDAALPSGQQDLEYEGTVISIEPSPLPGSHLNWVITTKVEKVLAGTFGGDTFAFRVHSPALSGLQVGGRYTIRATAVPEGYVVDEHQWRH